MKFRKYQLKFRLPVPRLRFHWQDILLILFYTNVFLYWCCSHADSAEGKVLNFLYFFFYSGWVSSIVVFVYSFIIMWWKSKWSFKTKIILTLLPLLVWGGMYNYAHDIFIMYFILLNALNFYMIIGWPVVLLLGSLIIEKRLLEDVSMLPRD